MSDKHFWVLVAIILCLVVYFNASCPDHQNSMVLVPSLLKENLGSLVVPARNKPLACYF